MIGSTRSRPAVEKVYSKIVVFEEDGCEKDSIVPHNWIKGNLVYYPSGLQVTKCYNNCTAPDNSWKSFRLKKVKFTGNESDCDACDFTTEDAETDGQIIEHSPKLSRKSSQNNSSISKGTSTSKFHSKLPTPPQSNSKTKKLPVKSFVTPTRSNVLPGTNRCQTKLSTPPILNMSSPASPLSSTASECSLSTEKNELAEDIEGDGPIIEESDCEEAENVETKKRKLCACGIEASTSQTISRIERKILSSLVEMNRKLDNLATRFCEPVEVDIRPIDTKKEFADLNEKLNDDKERSILIKKLRKIGGIDYGDATRNMLDRLFSVKLMSKMNLKGNDRKVGILNTNIWAVVNYAVSRSFTCCEKEVHKIIATKLRNAKARLDAQKKKENVNGDVSDISDDESVE